MKFPTEHAEQVTFVSQFRALYPGVRIFAVPNGGFRDMNTAKKLSAEGLMAGVPDLFVPAWNLWVEMKRVKGGRLSAEQKDWIEYLKECGHSVIVAKGWQEGMKEVTEWREHR